MLATICTHSKQSDGIFLTARPSHKSESESDGVKSGFRSDHDESGGGNEKIEDWQCQYDRLDDDECNLT